MVKNYKLTEVVERINSQRRKGLVPSCNNKEVLSYVYEHLLRTERDTLAKDIHVNSYDYYIDGNNTVWVQVDYAVTIARGFTFA